MLPSWNEYYKKDVGFDYIIYKFEAVEAILQNISPFDKFFDLSANTGDYFVLFSKYAKAVIEVELLMNAVKKSILKLPIIKL